MPKGTPNSKRKKFTKLTKETINKLEEAFAIDASIAESCFYANISTQTYYNWIKDNPELKERFDALRERPVLLARQTAVKKLSESYSNAMDYLSRKRKKEFSQRQELTGEDGKALFSTNAKKKIDEYLNESEE